MHTLLFRIILFVALVFAGVSGLLWVFAVLLFWYTWMHLGVEVIFVAMFIDAYFGYGGSSFYIYTISVATVVFMSSLLQSSIIRGKN